MNTELWTQTLGEGPDLVMLHGWALHSGVWHDVAEAFAINHRVTLVDLPGHGRNRGVPAPSNLEDLAARVLEAVPGRADWLGWSLGGMVAQQAAASRPDAVRSLCLTASTPRFVAVDGWPCAMEASVMEGFARELTLDFRKTVRQFLGLQVSGDERARDALRDLKRVVFEHGEPHASALEAGLSILANADLRPVLARLAQPALWVMGQYDRLTPPEAGRRAAAMTGQGRCEVVPRAAHAPFISHRDEYIETVLEFLDTIGTDSGSNDVGT